MKKIIPQTIKNIYHFFQAVLANIRYGFPSRKLKIIGVTGTNGKTTTVQMIAKILEESGRKIAVASTINFKIGDREWVNDTKFTTFSSFKLQEFLKKADEAGCEYAIIEVTSHAFDQNRVWGVDFDVAVITNITREHLDYHKTMERYQKAKQRLFEMVAEKEDGVAVVNLNMENAEGLLKYGAKKIFGYFLESQSSKLKAITQNLKLLLREI
ncbi:MAG: Mur ligase family protein [Candidatus Moranbacteria bacterium]|nr:Mur ligase family protein [Candidatus Moranbacteria bacterium]